MTEPAASGTPPPRAPEDGPPPRQATAGEEGFLARVAASPFTYVITAINIGVFVWTEYFAGGSSNESTLYRAGAVEPFHVWIGDYWRLFTCMFVHEGVLRIALSTFMLLNWASVLERAIGRGRFLAVYLLAGLGGSCVSVATGFFWAPRYYAGAFGALLGVVGALLALRRRRFADHRAFVRDRGVRSLALQFAILAIVSLAGSLLPMASSWPRFDNAAHLGGFATGAAMGLLFTARTPRTGWLAFAAAFVLVLVAATRPGLGPGRDGDLVAAYARAYLIGNAPGRPDGAWPKNVPRGLHFAEKGCAHRVALACEVLAQHLDRQGDPADTARSEALHRKTCEIDPPLCDQIH